MPAKKNGVEPVVSDLAGRRLSAQVARAYRGTYGAQNGLQIIVRSVSEQMLRAGSSPAVVSRTLTEYVRNCAPPGSVHLMTSTSARAQPSVLVELTAACVSDVAVAMAWQRRRA